MAVQKLTLPVLISSKQIEFQLEREDIRKLMERIPLLAVDLAADWAPQARPILDQSVRQARACAIYVGFYGCIYSEPTVQEYRAARENRYREILIYVKDCPGSRDAQLTAFLKELTDPTAGHTVLTYSDWSKVRQHFTGHLWEAIGRMTTLALRLGDPPAAMGDDAAILEQRWALEREDLLDLGLPDDPDRARALAQLIETQRPKQQSGFWGNLFRSF